MTDPTDAVTAVAFSPLELFLHADPVVKVVMTLLLVASVWAWAVILDKSLRLRRLHGRARGRLAAAGKNISVTACDPQTVDDPLCHLHSALVAEHQRSRDILETDAAKESLKERVHRIAQLTNAAILEQLQHGMRGLATIGSVSPFVGLFGTVWGIMNSFQGIATSNNTSLAVVAPGIAEALAATALGLFAAIPAVIFYNRISGEIGRYGKCLQTFGGLFQVELSRHLASGGRHGGPVA